MNAYIGGYAQTNAPVITLKKEMSAMGKLIDLTGQRFGRLTVVKRFGTYQAKGNPHTEPKWLCLCDCGEDVVVIGDNLRRGKTKSCGCLRREENQKNLEEWRKSREGNVG